ncbi:GNAT family N-acetyltransferase [Streptomyces canarius]
MTQRTDIATLEPQLANCRDYWLGWGAQERRDDYLSLFRSGLADGQLNGVMRLRDDDRTEEAVADAVKRFDGLPFTWWVGPDSGPEVRRRLVDGGARQEGSMPIMAVRTDQVRHVEGPDALRVRPIGDSVEELSDWVRTYSPSFGLPPELHDDLVRVERERTDAGRITRFAGRLDGQTVGTALLYVAHGVAGIYVVTTDASRRRRGSARSSPRRPCRPPGRTVCAWPPSRPPATARRSTDGSVSPSSASTNSSRCRLTGLPDDPFP